MGRVWRHDGTTGPEALRIDRAPHRPRGED
jgi:hypothetical protein